MTNETCAIWGDPGGADLIGCERLDDVSKDEILLGLGLTLAPMALAAPAVVPWVTQLARAAFPTIKTMANPKWWVTGTRAVAGGLGVVPNLAMQFYENGPNFREYNLTSVAFDYAVGAAGYVYVSAVISRYGVRMLQWKQLALWRKEVLKDWVTLGKQQVLFTMYATVIGLMRGKAAQAETGAAADAARMEGWLTAGKSQILQSFLLSAMGKSMFPQGMQNITVACMDRIISLIQNIAVRSYYGVVPGGGDGKRKWTMKPPPGLKNPDPIFGHGVGF